MKNEVYLGKVQEWDTDSLARLDRHYTMSGMHPMTDIIAGTDVAEYLITMAKDRLHEINKISQNVYLLGKHTPYIERTPLKFGVITIDWPWNFEVYNKDTGEGRSAAAHYDTDILGWDDWKTFVKWIWPLMDDNCALPMWMVRPSEDDAMDAVRHGWSEMIPLLTGRCKRGSAGAVPAGKDALDYKTELFTLVKKYRSGKPMKGMGYYSRANTEGCKLYVRGSMPRTDKGVDQVIEFCPFDLPKEQRHSHKPAEYRRRLERLWPNQNYLELFAREDEGKPGWVHLGNHLTGNDIRQDLRLLMAGILPKAKSVQLERAA